MSFVCAIPLLGAPSFGYSDSCIFFVFTCIWIGTFICILLCWKVFNRLLSSIWRSFIWIELDGFTRWIAKNHYCYDCSCPKRTLLSWFPYYHFGLELIHKSTLISLSDTHSDTSLIWFYLFCFGSWWKPSSATILCLKRSPMYKNLGKSRRL